MKVPLCHPKPVQTIRPSITLQRCTPFAHSSVLLKTLMLMHSPRPRFCVEEYSVHVQRFINNFDVNKCSQITVLRRGIINLQRDYHRCANLIQSRIMSEPSIVQGPSENFGSSSRPANKVSTWFAIANRKLAWGESPAQLLAHCSLDESRMLLIRIREG